MALGINTMNMRNLINKLKIINEGVQLVRRVYYEWDLETIDEYGDVSDHNHSDKFPGLPTDPNIQLVLVKDQGVGYSDDPGHFEQDDRSWAYVKDGMLPDVFQNGDRVPKRFHAELNAYKRPKFNETYKRKDYVRCPDGQRHDWEWNGGSVVELKTNRNIEDYKCANCRLTKTVFSDTGQRVNR